MTQPWTEPQSPNRPVTLLFSSHYFLFFVCLLPVPTKVTTLTISCQDSRPQKFIFHVMVGHQAFFILTNLSPIASLMNNIKNYFELQIIIISVTYNANMAKDFNLHISF